MGESTRLWKYDINNDIALFPYISSANIACGFHAGDAHTMHELVDAALLAGIAVGAHPGFADKDNFGRTNTNMPPVKIYDIIIYQLGVLDAFLKINGTRLQHVKPHGALYNMAAKDTVLATAICKAVKDFDAGLVLYGLSGSELIKVAAGMELASRSEVFADRTYQPDGSLTPRWMPNALITTTDQSLQQVTEMVKQGSVTAVNNQAVPIKAETICIHSDGEQALALAQRIYQTLNQQGIEIKAV